MTGNDQSQLRFDISEKVTFHREQSAIETLLSLDLVPEVHIEDLGANVMIQGAIRLTGTYLGRSDKVGQQLDEQLESEKIEYVIPVEITLPSERVRRLDAITAEIQSFDYDLLSSHELWIEAVLVIDGLELGQIGQSTSVTFATEETDQALVTEYDEAEKELKENEEISEDVRARQADEQGEEEAAQNDDQKEVVEQIKEDEDHEEEAASPLKGEQTGTQEVNTVEEPEESGEVVPHETSEEALSEESSKEAAEEEKEGKEGKAEKETIIHFHKKEEKPTPHDMWGDADAAQELTESGAATLEPADESYESSIPDMKHESSAQEQETEATGELPEDHSGEWTSGSAFEWIKQKLGDGGDQFHRLKMVIVQKDETLEHIAERYDMTTVELLQVNQLESGELQQGQVVYIPVKSV